MLHSESDPYFAMLSIGGRLCTTEFVNALNWSAAEFCEHLVEDHHLLLITSLMCHDVMVRMPNLWLVNN